MFEVWQCTRNCANLHTRRLRTKRLDGLPRITYVVSNRPAFKAGYVELHSQSLACSVLALVIFVPPGAWCNAQHGLDAHLMLNA